MNNHCGIYLLVPVWPSILSRSAK